MATNGEGAWGAFIEAPEIVRGLIDDVGVIHATQMDKADEARESAMEAIAALGRFVPPTNANFSKEFGYNFAIEGDFAIKEPPLTSFGTVDAPSRPDYVPSAIGRVEQIDFEKFEPGFSSITIPDAPEDRYFGDGPVAPVLDDVVLPNAPLLDKPLQPSLIDLEIPKFDFPELPQFNAQSPEFQGSSVSSVLQWKETPYKVSILDEEMAVLRRMWNGGTGLPLAVEQALWERAAEREDLGALREVSAAAIEFSGRGFTLPPGSLVRRVDAIRTEAELRKQSLGRDVMIKVADTQIENLRFACTQAIASEQVLLSVWSAIAGRAFEAAKIQLDSELALLNAQVAIYNAKQSAYATEATVFKYQLDARLATLEVYKTQLEGEAAKGQINEQRVRMYGTMLEALRTDVEIYKAQMQGAQLQSDVNRNSVEVFKAQVQAHAEVLQADKLRFDSYESRIKGETAKASLIDSQARAYSAYVSGQAAKADINVKNQQADIAVADMRLRTFIANLEKDKALIQQQASAIQANASAYQASTSRYTAEAGVKAAMFELEIKSKEAEHRNRLSEYEIEIRKFTSDMELMIRVASLQREALVSAAQAYSTLAAGAMAGISVGASVDGGARVSATGTSNVSHRA